jgi:hypothetical protein
MTSVDLLMTRDGQAIDEFVVKASLLRQVADDGETPGLLRFIDHFTGAIAEFGACELNARQAERYSVLDVNSELVPFHESRRDRHNERGLRSLASARDAITRVREEIEAFLQRFGQAPDLTGAADELRRDVRSHLARLELPATDVEKIDQALNPCFELARSGDAMRLPDLLDEQVGRLDALRREPDRGTRENIPWWKVIGIILAFGAFLWAFFKCGIFGCSVDEAGLVAAIGSIGAILIRFC